MTEEIDEYIDKDGSRKLAIGSELFSKRYEINRQPAYPDGIMITDLDAILDRETKSHDVLLETGMKDILKDEPTRQEDDLVSKENNAISRS